MASSSTSWLGRLPVGPLGVREVHLELGADPGQRAAQLVARVGDEARLAFGGVLEPAEHRVHGAGEPADLVLGRRVGDPAVEVLGADRPPPRAGSPRPGAARGRSTTQVEEPGEQGEERQTEPAAAARRLSVLRATRPRLAAT